METNNDGRVSFVFDYVILDTIIEKIKGLKIMKKGNLDSIKNRLKSTIYSNDDYITYVDKNNISIKLYVYDLIYNYLKKDYKYIILNLEYTSLLYTFSNEKNTVNNNLININIKKLENYEK